MLSESTIQELRQIIKEDYGKEMSLKETSEIAYGLIGYYDLLAKIYNRINQKNENDGEGLLDKTL